VLHLSSLSFFVARREHGGSPYEHHHHPSARKPQARVTQAADAAGTTTHNFIFEAIMVKVALAEQRTDFHAIAKQRHAEFLESGESIPWEEVRTYLMQRLAEKNAERPLARKQTR